MKQNLALFALLLTGVFSCCSQAADPTPAQEAEFLARVEKAFTSKDAAALLSLYCFDRAEPSVREKAESLMIPALFKDDFAEAKYEIPSPAMAEPYTLRGVTYAPNLVPVKALTIHFQTAPPATSKSVTMLLGMKDGALVIAVAAPVARP